MKLAVNVASVGFVGLAAFQAALAAGAPWGHAAWGGSSAHLSATQRIASGIAIVLYVGAFVAIRGRAAGRWERRYRAGAWIVVTVLALATVANAASESHWENYLLAPVALCLTLACVVIARRGRETEPDTQNPCASRDFRKAHTGFEPVPPP